MKSHWTPPTSTSTHTHRHIDSNAIDYPKPLLHFYWVREAGKRFSFFMDISALQASTSRSSFAVLSSHGWCEPQSFTGFYSPHVDSPGEAGSRSSLLSLCLIAFLFPLPNLLGPLPGGFLGELQFLFLYGGENWGVPSPSLKLAHLASEFRRTKGPHRARSAAHLPRQVGSKQPAFPCCRPQGLAACLPRLGYEFRVGRQCWPSLCDVHCPISAGTCETGQTLLVPKQPSHRPSPDQPRIFRRASG